MSTRPAKLSISSKKSGLPSPLTSVMKMSAAVSPTVFWAGSSRKASISLKSKKPLPSVSALAAIYDTSISGEATPSPSTSNKAKLLYSPSNSGLNTEASPAALKNGPDR